MTDPHLISGLSARGLLFLLLSVLLVMVASLAGQVLTQPALMSWYVTLNKPFFTPPNIVFPLVWTMLYALMAVAFWRVLRAKTPFETRKTAILLFLVQLVFNVAWSYAFFKLQSPLAGLVVIAVLLLSIIACLRAFLPIDRAAGYAMVPYAIWVAFASLLNGAIAVLNR